MINSCDKKDDWAVIFDLDGVIVDSYLAHIEAIKRWCYLHNLKKSITDEEFKSNVFGQPNQQWIPRLMGRPIDQDELQQLSCEKEKIFLEIFKQLEMPLVRGFLPLLMQLKEANIPLAIASSAPLSNVDTIISEKNIKSFFSVVLDDKSAVHGKPNPEIYLLAARKLNIAPIKCIVFEDSLVGIEAAQKAKCKVVGVATTNKPEDLVHSDYVIKDFTETNLNELEALVI